MPDSEVDKPGMKPSPQPGEAGQAASASGQAVEENIEDELDRLLAEIDIAIEELDPTGNLQEAAASARSAAVTGDPEYDEVEALFEVVVPEGKVASDEPTDALEGEPDEPADETEAEASRIEPTQIDQELDALLAEAETLLESPAKDEPAATASEDPNTVSKPADPGEAPEPQAAEVEVETTADLQATTEAPSQTEPKAEAPVAPRPAKAAPKQSAVSSDHYKPDKRLVGSEVETPKASDEKSSTKSIETLDADLANRAKKIVEEDTLPEAEDAFRSSDDVVEEVIDEHASAVDDASPPSEDTDELAQLMAESPASSDLSFAARAAGEPPAKMPPDATAAASGVTPAPAPKADRTVKRIATASRALEKIRPLMVCVARILSKPLEFVPPRIRDDIGWLASVTLFLAVAVWIALMLFR